MNSQLCLGYSNKVFEYLNKYELLIKRLFSENKFKYSFFLYSTIYLLYHKSVSFQFYCFNIYFCIFLNGFCLKYFINTVQPIIKVKSNYLKNHYGSLCDKQHRYWIFCTYFFLILCKQIWNTLFYTLNILHTIILYMPYQTFLGE